MADKLIVDVDRQRKYLYRIWWFLEEEQDIGACVGENVGWKIETPPKNRDDWEGWVVEVAIHKTGAECDGQGFFWESEAGAKKALRVAKEAIKQDRPLPEWARMALEEGWKPPKGWKA